MCEDTQRQRLDKWLWAARFFKTRSLAASQIQKGRVSVNGQRGKPSRMIITGDTVLIEKLPFSFEVVVTGFNEQRRPATEAQQLYEETAESQRKRAEAKARRRDDRSIAEGLKGDGRPSKRQRRQIIRFRNQRDDMSGE